MKATGKTAIAYVRVSTAGQVVDGASLAVQREKVKAWCMLNGYELLAVHSDDGISGCRMDTRPGVQAAIADAVKHKAALVVYSLSRLARSTRDAIDISEKLAKSGADLVSLSESIDTTSAAGKMVFRMLAVLAEFERDLTSERTAAALAHKRSKGERVSRFCPFGFRFDATGKRLLVVPEEQDVITRIAVLRAEGLSYEKVAAALNEAGVKPKRAKAWSKMTIARVIGRREKEEASKVAA